MKAIWRIQASLATGVICLSLAAACAPAPASIMDNPPGSITRGTDAIPTLTSQTTPRPSSTAALLPTNTPRPTETVSSTATQPAPDIVLPGWVPEGARARIGRGVINRIALSPDGKTVAVAGATGLSLFAADTFAEIWSVHTDRSIDYVSFSADGKQIATASLEFSQSAYPNFSTRIESVCRWSAGDGRLEGEMPLGVEGLYFLKFEFSPDGRHFVVARSDIYQPSPSEIQVWDWQAGEKLFTIAGDDLYQVDTIALSFDGKVLAAGTGSDAGGVYFWEMETGRRIADWRFDKTGSKATERARSSLFLDNLAVSPDGRTAAVGFGNQIEVWDIESGALKFEWTALNRRVTRFGYSPDGGIFAAGDATGKLILWNTESGHVLRTLQGAENAITDFAFDPASGELVSALTAEIRVWSPASGKSLRMLSDPYSAWEAAAVNSPGGEIATQTDGKIEFWDPESLVPVRTAGLPPDVAMAPDLSMYAVPAAGGKIRIVNSRNGGLLYTWYAPVYESPELMGGMIFSPDGRFLAIPRINTPNQPDSLELFSLKNGSPVSSFPYPKMGFFNPVYAVFSPHGKYLALGAWDWEYGSATTVYEVTGGGSIGNFSTRGVYRFALSDTKSYAALGCADRWGLCLYDLVGGGYFRFLESTDTLDRGPGRYSVPMVFSPDGLYVAAGVENGKVCVWDTADGHLLRAVQGHSGWVTSLRFSDDGKWLISAGGDGTAILWNVEG
jgi:WD40 repeat protein